MGKTFKDSYPGSKLSQKAQAQKRSTKKIRKMDPYDRRSALQNCNQ
jgi:hypothetical protein